MNFKENAEGMNNEEANYFIDRIIRINDLIVIGCNTSFSELEKEKNLPNGAIVKQSLRLAFTSAVKTFIEFREKSFHPVSNEPLVNIRNEVNLLLNQDPVEALIGLHIFNSSKLSNESGLIGTKIYSESLLQYVDIFRLRALVYRDTIRNDKNKLKPFVIAVSFKFYSNIYFNRKHYNLNHDLLKKNNKVPVKSIKNKGIQFDNRF